MFKSFASSNICTAGFVYNRGVFEAIFYGKIMAWCGLLLIYRVCIYIYSFDTRNIYQVLVLIADGLNIAPQSTSLVVQDVFARALNRIALIASKVGITLDFLLAHDYLPYQCHHVQVSGS
jgi:hypothetical protein